MADLLKKYPAYEGTEPYLYFAFCREDTRQVEPLLHALYTRGCRIWYDGGSAASASGRQHRLERSCGAALVVIYLSQCALADKDEVKSAVLYCQSRGMPVICLDAAPNSDLSTGFTGGTRHIPAESAEQMEAGIIRTEGFSQELLGTQQKAAATDFWKKAAAALLAAVLAVLGWLYLSGSFRPADTAVLNDPVISEAARAQLGVLTPDGLEKITCLQLSGVPADVSELENFPNLSRVEIPSEAVPAFADVLENGYVVVVKGGTDNG